MTSVPSYAVTLQGRILAWNKAAEHTFGYSKFQALNKNCWELLQGKDIFGNKYCDDTCPMRTAAMEGERINSFELDFMTLARKRERFVITPLVFHEDSGEKFITNLCTAKLRSGIESENHKHNGTNAQLTRREAAVLTRLGAGDNTKTIASSMGISVHTVRSHTQHILMKLGAETRLEAVALGRKLGLI